MPDVRKSGEWAPDAYVTQTQFGLFMDDFRSHAQGTKDALTVIQTQMAEGNTNFALIKKNIEVAESSLGSHSGKIRALEDKDKSRELRETIQLQNAQPRQYGIIATTAIQTVVGVCVVAILGYFYVSFMQTQEKDKKDNPPVHSVPPGKVP